jgi:hypothetical protein
LTDPYKEYKEKAVELGVHFEDLEVAEDHDYSDDKQSEKSEGTAYTNTETEESKQDSFGTTTKMPPRKASIASPSSTLKIKKPPSRKLADVTSAIEEHLLLTA